MVNVGLGPPLNTIPGYETGVDLQFIFEPIDPATGSSVPNIVQILAPVENAGSTDADLYNINLWTGVLNYSVEDLNPSFTHLGYEDNVDLFPLCQHMFTRPSRNCRNVLVSEDDEGGIGRLSSFDIYTGLFIEDVTPSSSFGFTSGVDIRSTPPGSYTSKLMLPRATEDGLDAKLEILSFSLLPAPMGTVPQLVSTVDVEGVNSGLTLAGYEEDVDLFVQRPNAVTALVPTENQGETEAYFLIISGVGLCDPVVGHPSCVDSPNGYYDTLLVPTETPTGGSPALHFIEIATGYLRDTIGPSESYVGSELGVDMTSGIGLGSGQVVPPLAPLSPFAVAGQAVGLGGDSDPDMINADALTNTSPTVTLGPVPSSGEGSVVVANASFSDPDVGDTHTATVNWGDTTPVEPCSVDQGADTVSCNHVYADNSSYPITVTVTDSQGASGADGGPVSITNVPPTVNAGANQTVASGAMVSLDPATFNDLGTLDTHTATIDWGDGSPVEPGTVTESPFGPPGSTVGANGTVSGSHVYTVEATYVVTVTVLDDDGDSTIGAFQVTVSGLSAVLTTSGMSGSGGSSTSSSYQLVPGVGGQSVTGPGDSSNYQLESGFVPQADEEIN